MMTMSTMTVLSLIFSLASIGHSLECILCAALVGNNCSGNSITCPDGSVCGSIYTETTEETVTSNTFKRSCIEKHQCNMIGSITLVNGRVKTAISCCDSKTCNPPPPMFPDDDREKNGKVCRSCSTANSDWCYTPDTVECSGNESMCALQTTKLSGVISLRTALRGCATRSICDLGSHRMESGGTMVDVNVLCTDGTSNLQQKSSISGLFILSVLNLLPSLSR